MSANSELVHGVDFVGVPTHDVPAAVAFYGETLGLKIYREYGSGESRGVVIKA